MKKELFNNRRILGIEVTLAIIFIIVSILISVFFFFYLSNFHAEFLKKNLLTIAQTASLHVNGDDLADIQSTSDMTKPKYKEIVKYLQDIKQKNSEVSFVYLMRKTTDADYLSFIADADSLKTKAELDENKNGIIESWEEVSLPGEKYDASKAPQMLEAFNNPAVDKNITIDKWGKTISGYAPIKNSAGQTVAIIGVDLKVDDYYRLQQRTITGLFIIVTIFCLIIAIISILVRQYRKEIKILEGIDRQKSDFISLASHQLRTPLSASKWGIRMLQQGDYGTLDVNQKKIITNLYSVNERMVELVNDLLKVSQLDAEELKAQIKKVKIETLIKDVVDSVDYMRSKKKINLSTEIDEKVKYLETDKNLIQEILHNLLINAIKYTENDGHVWLTIYLEKGRIFFKVEDTGYGVPRNEQLRLFSKFYRGTNILKKDLEGTGLGLYFVKKAVDLLGGKVFASSEENVGSVFYFHLPYKS